MAPGGAGKRKRGDRTFSQDSVNEGSRPAPHRPNNLNLARHDQQGPPQYGYRDGQGRGNRRGSRSSRGGHGGPRSPYDSPNSIPIQQRNTSSAAIPFSPTAPPAQRQTDL